MISFSIIIINFKTKELTRKCLDFIFKVFKNESFEIILIDNNSQDQSVGYFKIFFGNKIKIIENAENYGFGRANNQAAEQATGDLLFFLNSDTLIDKNIWPAVCDFFAKEKNLGILAPQLILPDGSPQPFAYGRFLNLTGLFCPRQIIRAMPSKPFSVDWVSGAAFFIRRELFERLGGFDEKFFMYFEDMDLCKRAKESGYEIKVLPGIEVTHLVGASGEGKSKQKKDYYDSQNYFFRKHYGVAAEIALKLFRWPYRIIRAQFFSRD